MAPNRLIRWLLAVLVSVAATVAHADTVEAMLRSDGTIVVHRKVPLGPGHGDCSKVCILAMLTTTHCT
jgi:hypothetical protein